MRNRFLRGMIAGAIIGTAAGMLTVPQLDRSSRSRLKRTSRVVKDAAEDMFGDMNMRHWMK